MPVSGPTLLVLITVRSKPLDDLSLNCVTTLLVAITVDVSDASYQACSVLLEVSISSGFQRSIAVGVGVTVAVGVGVGVTVAVGVGVTVAVGVAVGVGVGVDVDVTVGVAVGVGVGVSPGQLPQFGRKDGLSSNHVGRSFHW